MPEPSNLTRTLQQVTDIIRNLTPSDLSNDERSTMRALITELAWLVEQGGSR